MPRPRILLADDHGFILAGIRSLLEDRFDVVGQVSDGGPPWRHPSERGPTSSFWT